MDFRSAPLAFPALCLICAVTSGFHLAWQSVPLAGMLLAAGLALGRKTGASIVVIALGLLTVWARPDLSRVPPAPVDCGRPIRVSGLLIGEWERGDYGWQSAARVDYLYQSRQVTLWSEEVRISVTGDQRPLPGKRFRGRGYLRRASGLGNDPATRPGRWNLALKSHRFLEIREHRPVGTGVVALIKTRLRVALATEGYRMAPQVLNALLFGRRDALPRPVQQALRRLGLAHLFAVSGLHVALLAGGAFLACAPFPRRIRAIVATVVVALYVVLTGARPSVLRAGLMAFIAVLSLGLRRPTASVQSLAGAVIIMILHSPTLVADVGFQLTVAATAGIVLLTPLLCQRWMLLPRVLRRPLAASVGAQLACGPWVWSTFALLSPAAPLLTWLVRAPFSPVLTWPVSMTASKAFVTATSLLLALIPRRRVAFRLSLLVVSALLFSGPLKRPVAELTMIDIGQGDALLLRDGNTSMLVDGGGWPRSDIAARVLVPVLAARGIRSIDSLVVTHSDIDHCRGAVDLTRYLSAAAVLVSGAIENGSCKSSLSELPAGVLHYVTAGDSWSVGRWQVRTLHPNGDFAGTGNDSSLVLQARGFGHRLLLTGDIEKNAEMEILRRTPAHELESAILKVAHHGSSTSTGDEFLRAVAPRLALISSGRRNRYGHPAPEVVERLRASGASVLRTDRDGMVQVAFNVDGSTRIRAFGPAQSSAR